MWGHGRAPNSGTSPADSQHSSAHLQVSKPSTKPHHLAHHPCGCSLPGLFTNTSWIWVSSAHASLLPLSTWSTLPFFRLFAPLQIEKNSASATPMLPPTQEADGAFDSSHGSTLLYLLRADLYISNTCKLSSTANRPSLLILTSEGAVLYFSINFPPPPSPSPPANCRHSLFKPTCYQ